MRTLLGLCRSEPVMLRCADVQAVCPRTQCPAPLRPARLGAGTAPRRSDGGLFTSALAIVPLAGLLGKATEHLTSHVGAGLGGLLNASLGNAAELIIAFVALKEGLYDVVKASLTGSIIGNILLVLGFSMVAGGLRHEHQRFNRTAAGVGPVSCYSPRLDSSCRPSRMSPPRSKAQRWIGP